MNRLIIIGNGFDKAHGLETSYPEFMNWYWDTWRSKLAKSGKKIEKDALCSFKLKVDLAGWYLVWGYHYCIDIWSLDGIKLRDFLESDKYGCEFSQSGFLRDINDSVESKGWVDIEEEYYRILKSILAGKNTIDIDYWNHPEKLNDELSELTRYLTDYLTEIQNSRGNIKNDEIVKIFYGPVLQDDISISNQKEFENHIITLLSGEILP